MTPANVRIDFTKFEESFDLLDITVRGTCRSLTGFHEVSISFCRFLLRSLIVMLLHPS